MTLKLKTGRSTTLILLGGIVVNTWGLAVIPLDKVPLSPFWYSISGRTLSSLITLMGIIAFCPHALKRLFTVSDLKRLFISFSIVACLAGPAVTHVDFHGVTAAEVLDSLIFALFIGIEEDFFSRGFVFGVLEKHGTWIAALASSTIFGVSHLTNIVWGHQSASYTLAQAVSAGAFGFLAVALMIFSGSIWVPILMHALVDLPMQFDTGAQYVKTVTGQGDWVGVGLDLLIYGVIGWLLIAKASDKVPESNRRATNMLLRSSQ
jgi:membrane protease YdiL (CAAX protease family)